MHKRLTEARSPVASGSLHSTPLNLREHSSMHPLLTVGLLHKDLLTVGVHNPILHQLVLTQSDQLMPKKETLTLRMLCILSVMGMAITKEIAPMHEPPHKRNGPKFIIERDHELC